MRLFSSRKREWLPEPPKDKYFVAPVVLSQFYRSNVVFEDFKNLKRPIGWIIEPVRFVNCTNTRYMNLHYVHVPKYHVYSEFELLVGFGRILPKVVRLTFQQPAYTNLPLLFFHMSICNDLTVPQIETEIFNFAYNKEFLPQRIRLLSSEGDDGFYSLDELESKKKYKPRWSKDRAVGNIAHIRTQYTKVKLVRKGVVRRG